MPFGISKKKKVLIRREKPTSEESFSIFQVPSLVSHSYTILTLFSYFLTIFSSIKHHTLTHHLPPPNISSNQGSRDATQREEACKVRTTHPFRPHTHNHLVEK
ncbi:hypothetical protein I3842_03G232200 [Carya illinoinensis]|uniref:Uncharacterized protein n=1 Tax=Carya illinoinensis TaxID=32201 RepID=A0A922FJH3_CARIL|nr:hypothetical protein I3842_03G232200 [Carya illinoinensis]